MASRLDQDLRKLDELAYNRREWSEANLRRYHAFRLTKGGTALREIRSLYQWLFVPITLWPVNVDELFLECLEQLTNKGKLDARLRLLLEAFPSSPTEEIVKVVAQHEHQVQGGVYEDLVTTTAKFEVVENALADNPNFREEWNQLKRHWNPAKFGDHKGVVRRTLGNERNLRQPFSVDWKKPIARFQAIFDSFCLKWNLYGMQNDSPLLLKLSVNLTPHGTMIFIPSYWSFDAKRDVKWDAVMRLHRARSAKRQGAVLTEGIESRRELAIRLESLVQEAKRRGLKGDKRHAFVCAGLGWVEETSPKRLARLRAEFKITKS